MRLSRQFILGVTTMNITPEKTNVSSKLILLADDNTVNQKVGVRQLQRLGYRADAVANGREAIQALSFIKYDLVLMDCQMPEMNGYDATREIRRIEPRSQHIPIVALTAHAVEGNRQVCLDCGMDDYLSKPVGNEELSRVLKRFLNDSRPEIAPAETASGPVDLNRFHDVTGNSTGECSEILEEYLSYMSTNLEKLAVAVTAHDYREVELIAHNCAGTSATCGMNAVVAPLRELESAGRKSSLQNALPLIGQTRMGFESIRTFLKGRAVQPA
jgi:CheY-like chemotaxis protein